MQPHRRRKTLLACNQCRDRKTRCSGDRPLCRSCQDRQLQCRYEQALNRSSPSLERHNARTDRSGLYPTQQPHPPDVRQNALYQLRSTQTEMIGRTLQDGITSRTAHGDASTDSFLSRVSSIANVREHETDPGITSSSHSGTFDWSPQLCNPPAMTDATSDMDVDVVLMEIFWKNIHPIFPLLHRPSFLQRYELHCEPQRAEAQIDYQDNDTFQAILNIVLALGVQYDKRLPFKQRVKTADEFYQRSLGYVSSNAIDHPTRAHVQLFLLTAVYLHATAHANRCWDMVGAGLRVAIGLGLFREGGSFHGKESQLKREMRRRIWYCCVVLDKLSAATFGRPTTLPRSWETTRPKAIDDEFLQHAGEGSQPPGLPSYLEGFVYTIDLFEILDDVLAVTHNLHDDEPGGDHRDRARKPVLRLVDTLSLNSRLEDLAENIPDRLKLAYTNESVLPRSRDMFSVQAQVLHCRIHYVRLLILRPWLLEGKCFTSTSLGASTLQEIRSLCIVSAQQTIDIIYEAETRAPKTSSWHAVYFLYAAASILLAAALLPKASGGIDLSHEPYQTSWHKALQMLRNNEVQLQACVKAVSLLESCQEKLRSEVINRVSEGSSSFLLPRT
ncbi:fungal-specific transcription factor domain-containing protein [Boeremia exigua]|uniref:fungal-specific transcription factor domain-containing protein n=1 Tax=Boeremia exigua TaxID=749465 RepID=UPI001E8CAB56|nr:fungal-specific transcription factor domain-containing protein [Boeremia exigua]KAH6613057.1 fungal-specific transcription factor domain-containing protein [Boeremia exigua]